MKLHKIMQVLPDIGKSVSIKCHDYSKFIDIDVYVGGYGDWCMWYFYTAPDEAEIGREVNLILIDEDSFKNQIEIDDKYIFLKSFELPDGNISRRYFIFFSEKFSLLESRGDKIEEILE